MIGKSRKSRVNIVKKVDHPGELLIVGNVLKVVILAEIGVKSYRREAANLATGIEKGELLDVRISGHGVENRVHAGCRTPNTSQQGPNCGVNRANQSRRRRHRENVNRAGSCAWPWRARYTSRRRISLAGRVEPINARS